MGTKTISLADDAYERLKAEKREGESFSDVVRRLTAGVALSTFHGTLSDETADEVEDLIAHRRAARNERRTERIGRLSDLLDDS